MPMVFDAGEVPQTPSIEAVIEDKPTEVVETAVAETELNDAAFLVRFGMDKTGQVYSDACKNGYKCGDGNLWLKSGGKKTRIWTTQVEVNTQQLTLAV